MSSVGPSLATPGEANNYHAAFVARLAASFAHVTGRNLIAEAGLDLGDLGLSAWLGDFALLSHRGGPDAVLNYGNAFALRLWDYDWDSFITVPSAATAPSAVTPARDLLMQKVHHDNFVSGYSGERISRTGRRFIIQDVTVWRLLEETGGCFGMAAFFRRARDL